MPNNRHPICFVISSPSGAGKTTLVERVLQSDPDLQKTVSYTTRAKRPEERDGVHYHFVDQSTFDDMKNRNEFLEWAQVYGHSYATSKGEIERILSNRKDAILVIENHGAKAIQSLFPFCVFILVVPPSIDELKFRIMNRKHAGDDVIQRLKNAEGEIRDLQWFDYRIVNDKVESSVELLQAIIRAERSKIRLQLPAAT